MKTTNIIIAISIVLLIAFFLFLFWDKRVAGEHSDIDITRITKVLEEKVNRAETLRQNVIVKAKDDSVKYAIVNKAKDEEIARLKRSVKKVRTPHVDTVLIQDPEVGRYAAMLDSLVVTQDSQITELKEQKAEQWASFNQLITTSDSTAQANKELNEFVNKTLEVDNKRLKRQNRALKIGCVAIPLAIVGVVMLAK